MSEIKLPHDHGHDEGDIISYIPSSEDFALIAQKFKKLCDFSRLRIFWVLCHCEECVLNLSAMVEMSSPAVSHHLKLLKEAGLVVSRRDGKEVYYKAADTPEAEALHTMIETLISITCPKR